MPLVALQYRNAKKYLEFDIYDVSEFLSFDMLNAKNLTFNTSNASARSTWRGSQCHYTSYVKTFI